MSVHLRSFPRFLAGSLPGVVVLVGLVALGYWGHAHDWRFRKAEEKAEVKAPEGTELNLERPIHLASEEIVSIGGLRDAPVEERRMPEYVTAPGLVEYDHFHLAHLSSPVQGTVWRILKGHGQQVARGTILALINTTEVGKAKADLLQAQVHVNQRTKILRLLNPSLVQARQVEEAEMNLQEAKLQRLISEQALLNLGLPVTASELEGLSDEQLAEHIRFLGLPDDLKKELARETNTANLYPLRSPFDGVVVEHDIALGEVVSTLHTQPLYIVADLRMMWISLSVRVEDIGRLKLEQELTFRPDQTLAAAPLTPGEWSQSELFFPIRAPLHQVGVKGTIEWISPEMNEKTRTVKLHAHVENPGGQLLANGFGTGSVLVSEKPNALVVPRDALQEDGPIQMVFVKVDETTFQPRQVKTGLRHGDLVEITEGVKLGENVVTTGSHMLKSELLKSRLGSDD